MSREREHKAEADKFIRHIKRRSRRKFNAEEKIRIVLDGFRGDKANRNTDTRIADSRSTCNRMKLKSTFSDLP
jgi:transposase-like protein